MSKRMWLAWVVSLAGHGLLVFGIVQLCAFLRSSPDSSKPTVNRVIDAPPEYANISVSFGEEASKPEHAPEPQQVKPVYPTPKEPVESPIANPATPPKNHNHQGTEAPTVVQAGHREFGIAPLHSKITRPGMSIVYVLDQSGSMAREGKLRRAIAMLRASLRQLGPDVRFQIVAYDSKPAVFRIGGTSDLVSANMENIAKAEAILEQVVGEGSSRHCDGLMTGIGLHPDVLILLTDADELMPHEVKRLKDWNRKGTSIHAVLFGTRSDDGESSLRQLAGANRVHSINN